MSRYMSVLVMMVIAVGLGACAGPDVISASEQQIVLNAPDQDRAARHCRGYGKSVQSTVHLPQRVTYACQ